MNICSAAAADDDWIRRAVLYALGQLLHLLVTIICVHIAIQVIAANELFWSYLGAKVHETTSWRNPIIEEVEKQHKLIKTKLTYYMLLKTY